MKHARQNCSESSKVCKEICDNNMINSSDMLLVSNILSFSHYFMTLCAGNKQDGHNLLL